MIDLLAFGGNVITVMLGSGAAFGILKWHTDWKTQQNKAKFLATQLAVQLEGYAIDCSDKISGHITAEDSNEAAGDYITKIVEYPPLPVSDAYQSLERSIADEVLQFPQECQMAERAARFLWEVADTDACLENYKDNTIRIGAKAAELAKKIREHYSLPMRKLTFGEWDVYQFFADELKKVVAREKKYAGEM